MDTGPVLFRRGLDIAHRADAGVVDENVEHAEAPLDFGDDIRPVPAVGDVVNQTAGACSSEAKAASPSASMSVAITVAPSRVSSLAVASPSPEAAPVTSAIFPATRPDISFSSSRRSPCASGAAQPPAMMQTRLAWCNHLHEVTQGQLSRRFLQVLQRDNDFAQKLFSLLKSLASSNKLGKK